jgi:hypothetical protein
VVAVTFKSAVDDPSRIAKSKAVGTLFGLTPKKYQSGEKDVTGGITRTGDEMVRTALYEAANVLLSRITRFSKLKRWGMDVAKRRGSKRASRLFGTTTDVHSTPTSGAEADAPGLRIWAASRHANRRSDARRARTLVLPC